MGGHILVMLAWLQIGDRKTLNCLSFSYNLLYAFIYLLYFCNLGHDPLTLKQYVFYYTVTLVENLVLVLVPWHFDDADLWYYDYVLVAVLSTYFLGMVLQSLYYSFFHPNAIRKTCGWCCPCCVSKNNS